MAFLSNRGCPKGGHGAECESGLHCYPIPFRIDPDVPLRDEPLFQGHRGFKQCAYFLVGVCPSGGRGANCKHGVHDIPCRFYLMSKCSNGGQGKESSNRDTCHWGMHSRPLSPSPPILRREEDISDYGRRDRRMDEGGGDRAAARRIEGEITPPRPLLAARGKDGEEGKGRGDRTSREEEEEERAGGKGKGSSSTAAAGPPPQHLCYAFAQGFCSKGDICPDVHSESMRRQFWKDQGRILPIRNSIGHVINQNRMVQCPGFKVGKCYNGALCKRFHSEGEEKEHVELLLEMRASERASKQGGGQEEDKDKDKAKAKGREGGDGKEGRGRGRRCRKGKR